MKQCADCGGMITIVNAETVPRDGWERHECGGCHRHLSFLVTIIVDTPAMTLEEGKPTIDARKTLDEFIVKENEE